MTAAPAPAPSWAVSSGAWLACVGPLLLAVSQLHAVPRWDEDVAVVRALGAAQVGAEGVLSGACAFVTDLLPFGSRLLRAALVSALAAGLSGGLLFSMALNALRGRAEATWPDVVLATSAALLACFTPSWQVEATRVGGATLAALLALSLVRLATTPRALGPTSGVLLGLLLTESHWAALAAALALATATLSHESPPRGRDAAAFGVAAVLSASVMLAPSVLRRIVGGGSNLGLSLGLPLGMSERPVWSLAGELGLTMGALLVLGVLSTLLRRRTRRLGLVWLAVAAVAGIDASPAAALCALAAAAQFVAFGFRTAWGLSCRIRLPFAPLAGRLGALLCGCVLLLVVEDGRQAVARREISAVRAWTEEAFESLPPGALVIASSPEIAWRLWAARVTEGTRPDVTLVPSTLLAHGRLARVLLEGEPRMAGLIRDYAMSGTASELSLSQLADARPLKVELDHDWDRRLLAYLTPDGLWSDVAPHALGRTDRKRGYRALQRSFERVLSHARTPLGTDDATLARVYRDLYQHALLSATLGDRALAERILRRLKRIHPDDPECQRLRERLRASPRGAGSVRAMLR